MQWVESNGVRLHTECMGSGPLLVMCHGLITANLATWYFSAAPALARHYKVVLYDLRGHGTSALAPNGYDVETMTRDLEHVIDAYRPECRTTGSAKIALVGHSYGALIALNYALRHPQGVARLALIDAPLPAAHYVYPSLAGLDSLCSLQQLLSAHGQGQPPRQPLAEELLLGEQMLGEQLPGEQLPRDPLPRVQLLGEELPGDQLPRVQLPQGRLFQKQPARGRRNRQRAIERLEYLLLHSSLREDLRAAGDVPDARLEALHVSTLCLYGRHSDCAAAGRRLARLLPRGELRWLDSDHFIPTRAPAAMTEELLSYFARGTQQATGYAYDGSEQEVTGYAVHDGT